MKKSTKRLVSAVIAAASAMSMALSAYAADYGSEPSYSSTPSQGVAASTGSIAAEVKSAVKTAVTDALKNVETSDKKEDSNKTAEVKVASTTNLKITTTVIKELAKSENVELKIVSNKATISIDSSKIKSVKTVDLSARITNTDKKTKVKIGSNKSFGCEVKITLTQCKLSAAKLKKAHWYLNGEDMGPVKLDKSGRPVITLTKGGVIEVK